MNTSGVFPLLVGADTVATIKTYTETLAAVLGGGTAWDTVTIASGWAGVTGYPLQVRRFGKLVELRGMVKYNSGAFTTTMCNLPAKYRPVGSNVWIQPSVLTVSKAVANIVVTSGGDVYCPAATYYTGTPVGNDLVALHGTWHTDNV